VAQMQQPQVELPSLSSVVTSHMGLGWGLHSLNADGRRIFGHGGETWGQMSMLRIVPDQEICIAILVNGENAELAYQTVINALLKELADFDLSEPAPSFVTMPDEQLFNCIGDYKSFGEHFSITMENNQLTAVFKDLVTKAPAINLRLKPLGSTLWGGFNEEDVLVARLRFLDPDDSGHYRYVFNGRMLPRVEAMRDF